MIDKTVQFVKDAYSELQKVTWLGRQELIGSTILIIVLVAIMATFISIIDFFCLRLVGWII